MDEPAARTFKEKLLFYTTAFFILLATFSLFAFLFLVPFVIEPAFSTIFKQFDTTPALCVTLSIENFKSVKNCSWTSCREGCTKDIYECTQIRVNYKLTHQLNTTDIATVINDNDNLITTSNNNINNNLNNKNNLINNRVERAIREYADYDDDSILNSYANNNNNNNNRNGVQNININLNDDDDPNLKEYPDDMQLSNSSEWFFAGARLYPNVKGCGYPPMLNCSIWYKKYNKEGTNFSCYYSKVDPGLVISDLDLWQNTLNLVYAMAIPIPSFIISVIYLTIAYFKIYNDDEETVPLDKNAEDIAGGNEDDDIEGGIEDENNMDDAKSTNINTTTDDDDNQKIIKDTDDDEDCCDDSISHLNDGIGIIIVNSNNDDDDDDDDDHQMIIPNGGTTTTIATSTTNTATTNNDSSKPITPNSDVNSSFGHQLKVKMADEMSRDSIDTGLLSKSASIQGYFIIFINFIFTTSHSCRVAACYSIIMYINLII